MAVHLEIADPEPLVDRPVQFRVLGLAPGQTAVVRCTWRAAGTSFVSEGAYDADRKGAVDPASQASRRGTYLGTDPYGLWWSGRPVDGQIVRPSGLDPVPTRLTAVVGGEEVASATIRRLPVRPTVTVAPVGTDGLVGLSFRPGGRGPFPAAMVLGGSTGGLTGADVKAALLASHGIAALALAYFGAEGRPAHLADIPLEYLHAGLSWLRRQPHVAAESVGVVGGSRGGELALLLGATYAEIRCVVACAPSSVVWGGVGPGRAPDAAAWTVGGRPVATMKRWRPELLTELYADDPIRLEPLFGDVLGDEEAVGAAAIPIERTNGPILLISGEDDAIWPATRMASAVVQRAAARDMPHPVRHVHYRDAGHLCASPPGLPLPPHGVLPATGRRFLFGGTPPGNAAACADSWARTLDFLHASLDAAATPAARQTTGSSRARSGTTQSTP